MIASAPIPEWVATAAVVLFLVVTLPALVAHLYADLREQRAQTTKDRVDKVKTVPRSHIVDLRPRDRGPFDWERDELSATDVRLILSVCETHDLPAVRAAGRRLEARFPRDTL